MKLMMSDWKVELVNDNINEFMVDFAGPKDSPYEGGVWKVHVELPDSYPYKSPSIGFVNRMYHPNVDEGSGSVCLDVINQTWSPMFDLVNVFEVFLPQLLLYPNPTDPLNGEAASTLMYDPAMFNRRVKDHVRRFASPEVARTRGGGGGGRGSSSAVAAGDSSSPGQDAGSGATDAVQQPSEQQQQQRREGGGDGDEGSDGGFLSSSEEEDD